MNREKSTRPDPRPTDANNTTRIDGRGEVDHLKRLKSDRDWYGYLTLENAEAVADRVRSMIGDGQPYTWVAANEYFGYKPEVRTGQVASKVEFAQDLKLSDGTPWAHLSVVDTYGIWGLHTDAVDEMAARKIKRKDRTVLKFEHRKLTIELYAPGGNHMWRVVAVEDSTANVQVSA